MLSKEQGSVPNNSYIIQACTRQELQEWRSKIEHRIIPDQVQELREMNPTF